MSDGSATPARPSCQDQVLHELRTLAAGNRPGCFNSVLIPQDTGTPAGAYRLRLRRQLAASDVAQLLACGPDRALEIYDHTPAWAHVFLGPRPKDIRETTRLVALNLDWYLDRPRPLLRQAWINQCLTASALLACTLVIFLFLSQVIGWGELCLLAWLVVVVIWIALQGDYQRSVWINELHDHLYAVYTGLPPGEDTVTGADSGHNDSDVADQRRE